jgi:hypothetical protein
VNIQKIKFTIRYRQNAGWTLRAAGLLPICILLAVAPGCASHKEKIVFSDADEVRAAVANAATEPVQRRLEKADQLKIEQLVFGYLLERHFWDLADYSAVFLQTDDAQVADMIKKYPNHVPPIKQSFHASIQSHRAPVDRDTDKPAMILNVDVNEPNPDNSVDAIGRWYAGDAVTGFRAFHLQKVDGDWQIADVR